MDEEYLCGLCGNPVDPETGTEYYDGWICEDCLAKLSPWIEDFEALDQDDLEEQLQLREENRKALKEFCPTRSFALPGMTEKIYLDDEKGTFLVTENRDILEENPDLFSLEEVIDASLQVDDDREKLGDHLYDYSYDLSFEIVLDHAYVDEIVFSLHPETLHFESEEKSFLGFGGFEPDEQPAYRAIAEFGQDLSDALTGMEEEINHRYDVRPGEFRLTEASSQEASGEELPDSGEVTVCPWCGVRTHVTGDLRCEHCGGNL